MVLKMKAHTHIYICIYVYIYTLCIFIRILFIFQAFCCGNLVYACICVINQSTHWCAYWGPCLAFAGGLLGMERPRTWSSVLLYLELVNWINLLLSGNWSWKGFRCNVLPCSKPLICTGLNSFFLVPQGPRGPTSLWQLLPLLAMQLRSVCRSFRAPRPGFDDGSVFDATESARVCSQASGGLGSLWWWV